MNTLAIIILIIIGVCALQGITEGFIKTAFRFFLNVAVFALSVFVTPILMRLVLYNFLTDGMGALPQVILLAVIFVVLRFGVKFIVTALDIIAKLPVLKTLNRVLGLLTGMLEGVIIVWAVLGIASFIPTTEFGMWIETMSAETPFVEYLKQNNILLDIVLKYIFKT